MIKRAILAGMVAGAVSGPALASHCPADMKAIDHALSSMSLPADTMAEVKTLREEGEALHEAGKHKESTDALAKAMRLILESQ